MLADIRILFQSDVYQVERYQCHCDICSISNAEYEDCFCVSFIQKGYFEYRTFKKEDDVHTGRILISKPGFPHTTRHIDQQPDITTTFEFRAGFFETIKASYTARAGWFLNNPDVHSLVISSEAALDHLHHIFLQRLHPAPDKLYMDELVMHLVDRIMNKLGNVVAVPPLPDAIRQYHLPTIEQAQDYLLQHFREDISLQQVAQHCHTSPFHFSRIFKSVLGVSPHQYLLGIRLHQAKRLLAETRQPVSDIAYDCGFNSLEHFATAYKKQYAISPSGYRKQLV